MYHAPPPQFKLVSDANALHDNYLPTIPHKFPKVFMRLRPHVPVV